MQPDRERSGVDFCLGAHDVGLHGMKPFGLDQISAGQEHAGTTLRPASVLVFSTDLEVLPSAPEAKTIAQQVAEIFAAEQEMVPQERRLEFVDRAGRSDLACPPGIVEPSYWEESGPDDE